MSRPIAVLRPEPGNAATVHAIASAGGRAIACPLFAVRPLAWQVPDPAAHDALILTSANAARHGGAGLGRLAMLPVYAVGAATAESARAAGLGVVWSGTGGVAAVMAAARAAGVRRALHLAGREHRAGDADVVSATCVTYVSDAIQPPQDCVCALAGSVAMVHSPRAAEALAGLAALDRATIHIAAISARAAAAAGTGWAGAGVADAPDAHSLLALALRLAD